MGGRRVGASATAAAVALLLAGGCGNALKNRTMSVLFKDSATQSDLVSASRACAHSAPGIQALPVPSAPPPQSNPEGSSTGRAGTGGEIQFRIGGISDHDLARLDKCLNNQPGVLAVEPPNDDMS